MTYQATITAKGQITIPKAIRDMLGLSPTKKIQMSVFPNKSAMVIKPVVDLLTLAETIQPKRKLDVLKAREEFETQYERV